jgi:hypothetical protein
LSPTAGEIKGKRAHFERSPSENPNRRGFEGRAWAAAPRFSVSGARCGLVVRHFAGVLIEICITMADTFGYSSFVASHIVYDAPAYFRH